MKIPRGRLGDHVDFSNGKSSPERDEDAPIPVYGSNGQIGYCKEANAPKETSVIGRVGSYCGSIHFSKNACWVTDNAIKATAKVPQESRFWFYAMANRDLHDLRAGSGQPLINQTSLKAVELPVPDAASRLEIAKLLGALDDKIELNRRMSATLEEMARALYRSWFVDFDPVHARALGQPPAHMDTTTAALFPDSFGSDGLPKEWRTGVFGQSVEIISGGTPKTSVPEYWSGDIPWYSVVDAPGPGSIFVLDTEKKITAAGFEGCAAKMVDKGTTIISARGTIGKLAMASGPMVFNQSCYGLRGSRANMSEFVYFATLRAVELLQSMSHGSVFSTITRKTFDGLELVKPSDQVMSVFADQAGLYLDKALAAQLENSTLDNLRDTLLPRLMCGELRIRDAEKRVEEVV